MAFSQKGSVQLTLLLNHITSLYLGNPSTRVKQKARFHIGYEMAQISSPWGERAICNAYYFYVIKPISVNKIYNY